MPPARPCGLFTEGIQSPAIKGQYTLTAALEILLARTRLAYREVNPKTIEIRLPAVVDPPLQ